MPRPRELSLLWWRLTGHKEASRCDNLKESSENAMEAMKQCDMGGTRRTLGQIPK